MRIGGVHEHFNYPWHLAIEHQLFEKKRVKINWKTCRGGTGEMCQLLLSNKLDAAILLTEGAVKFIAENQQFFIANVFVKSPLVWGVHVPFNSTITQYNNIFDHPIAISRKGSGSHLMPIVDAYFKQKNVLDSMKLKI